MSWRSVGRFAPFAVSALALGALFTQIEVGQVADALSWRAALFLLPALIAYGGASLWIEAVSLVRIVPDAGGDLALGEAARIKAATYLLGIVQYALGLGALAVLLRRRAGISLGDAAGVALLVSGVDLLILTALVSLGAAFMGVEAAEVRAGVLVAGVGAFAFGFVLLRAPGSLGPLDRLRELAILRALRRARMVRLGELAVLRLLFVVCFMSLAAVALHAFAIAVPVADLVAGIAVVVLVAALPIAVAGIGTSQIAFVFAFRQHADEATLLACNLVLSAGLIVLRVGLGLLFAREYAREAKENAASPRKEADS